MMGQHWPERPGQHWHPRCGNKGGMCVPSCSNTLVYTDTKHVAGCALDLQEPTKPSMTPAASGSHTSPNFPPFPKSPLEYPGCPRLLSCLAHLALSTLRMPCFTGAHVTEHRQPAVPVPWHSCQHAWQELRLPHSHPSHCSWWAQLSHVLSLVPSLSSCQEQGIHSSTNS